MSSFLSLFFVTLFFTKYFFFHYPVSNSKSLITALISYVISISFIFSDNGDFYPGYPGYNDFYPGQGQDGNVNFLPPNGPGGPLDQVPHPAGK